MTYRDLFIAILESKDTDLNTVLSERVHFIIDGNIMSFDGVTGEAVKYLSEEEYAAKCGAGVATVRAWCQADMIKRFVFDKKNYILETEKNPMEVK